MGPSRGQSGRIIAYWMHSCDCVQSRSHKPTPNTRSCCAKTQPNIFWDTTSSSEPPKTLAACITSYSPGAPSPITLHPWIPFTFCSDWSFNRIPAYPSRIACYHSGKALALVSPFFFGGGGYVSAHHLCRLWTLLWKRKFEPTTFP